VSLQAAFEHDRGIFHGIRRFAHARPDMRFLLISLEGNLAGEIERIGNVDGIIGTFTGEGPEAIHLEAAKQAAGARVVGFSSKDAQMDIPRVLSDGRRVGEMAADHLLSLGYEHFSYLFLGKWNAHAGMQERYLGFSERLAESGRSCRQLQVQEIYDRSFGAVPRSAIFTFNVIVARQLIERLAEIGIAVPEEVAVLGVDQDPFQETLSPVPISTIALDTEKIGFEAAALMEKMVNGASFEPGHIVRIQPIGVVERTSTKRFENEDPIIRKALGLLRSEIPRITSVSECAALVGTSRSTLERRFRWVMGSSVREAMEAARVEHTKKLLCDTDMKLVEVAAAAGYGDGRMLSVSFRRATGETPSAFRKRLRTGKAGLQQL
jgi:LacI family transcriptional regulator